MQPTEYPVQFSVDYPDRPLNRLTTLIRPIMALPILAVLIAISGWLMFLGLLPHPGHRPLPAVPPEPVGLAR